MIFYLKPKSIFILSLIIQFSTSFFADSLNSQKLTLFKTWQQKYGLQYYSTNEFSYRLNIFWDNHLLISSHNQRTSSFKMGLNGYADLTDLEFEKRFTSQSLSGPREFLDDLPTEHDPIPSSPPINKTTLDRKVDWIARGGVTKIKDQMQCGSCYAFAGISAIETAHFASTGELIDFSEQPIVDCGHSFSPLLNGCSFSNVKDSMEFYLNIGLWTSKQKPYYGSERQCGDIQNPFKKITGYERSIKNELDLIESVSKGATTISMEMNFSTRWYESGVLDIKAPCGFKVNHLVTVVGYDLDALVPYFTIKNSWGEIWGNKGYMNIKFIGDQTQGMCSWIGRHSFRPYF